MCNLCQDNRKKFHTRLPFKGLKQDGDEVVKNSKKKK